MLKIYETVARLLYKQFPNPSEEFRNGAEFVLKMFEIGIRTSTRFNSALRVKELEIEVDKQKATIEQLRREIANKQDRLLELSLISGVPLTKFITYTIPVKGHKPFDIVTNMDEETIQACLFNFNARHTYKRPDEAKFKLIAYINSKKHYGFHAYKDWKTFRKEHLKKQK